MKGKTLWLLVSCLLTVVLLLSSCKAAPAEEAKEEAVAEEVKEEAPAVKEPQYGGTLRVAFMGGGEAPPAWDPGIANWIVESFVSPIYEKPAIGDVDTYGPRGNNEFHFAFDETVALNTVIPHLAESWEITEDSIIYNVRKGIHFQNKPPVNGREMDAYDMALSLNRTLEVPRFTTGYWSWVDTIKATGKYTVEIKFKEFNGMWKFYVGMGYYTDVVPRELVEQELIEDWKNACGTGPFMIDDYVDGVAATYKRNPDYWGKSIIDGKEYQLPLIDNLEHYIMPDPAAYKAAMITGKVDIIQFPLDQTNFDDIVKASPEVKSYEFPYALTDCLHFRTDIPPTDDIRVRKALMYAINYSQLRELSTGRTTEWCSMVPLGWGPSQYTPLEDIPRECQMYFEHNPEEAKKLLAEAGYPNGFQIQLMLPSYPVSQDRASVIAANWEAIGVKTELKVLERTVLDTTFYAKKHSPALMVIHGHGLPLAELQKRIAYGSSWNISCWEDPKAVGLLNGAFEERDQAKSDELVKELNMYWLDQAVEFRCPQEYCYRVWWPWLKNYAGACVTGYKDFGGVWSRIWIDEDLKKEMGH